MTGSTLQGRLVEGWGIDSGQWQTSGDGPRCIGFSNRRGAIEWWSAARLLRESSARAAWMKASGLGAGQVAILVTAEPRFAAVSMLAILQLGAVPLLVAPRKVQGLNSNLDRILTHVVGLSQARVVLLPTHMAVDADNLASTGVSVLVGDAGPEFAGQTVPVVERRPNDLVALQLTSGTTGLPRICTWEHHQLLAAIDGMYDGMDLQPDDRFVNWTPLYHDMGLVNNTLLCLVKGLELVLMDPFHFVGNPALWLKVLDQVGATQTWSPNFGYALAAQRIREGELEGVRLDRMRGFWNAGEKVHYQTFEAFYERFEGHGLAWNALKANFGCAENIGGATFTDPHGAMVVERVDLDALHGRRVAEIVDSSYEHAETVVSTGTAHPTLEARILGDDNEALADGHVGRIALVSPSRMVGFMGEPEKTREVLGDDYVLTGDLGYLRAGELFWVGRDREQINLSGMKYDPSDFEAALDEIEPLRKGCFAAFGVEDEELGTQRLVVLCEVRGPLEGDGVELCASIRASVARSLGISVSEVVLTARGQLTKTSSGKRRHLHFRDEYLAGTLDVLVRDY